MNGCQPPHLLSQHYQVEQYEPAQLNTYELEREARIRANREKALSLGIILAKPASPVKVKAPPAPKRQPVELAATRKSERLRGASATNTTLSSSLGQEELPDLAKQAQQIQKRDIPADCSEAEELRELNLHRLATMSDKALRVRIRKIRKVVKLQSFISVLRETNVQPDLIEEAEKALELLTD
ncbi:hypothetical protein WJX73_004287 [Symbiochloris irregularis]|uniref:Uncharacterized protein n=1 Tax=Symbiochloris irregularis TaxID=706552 RepID=A0AAW1P4M3_9CHLO